MYKPRQKILFLMGWHCGRTVGELDSYILLEIRIVLARKLISMNRDGLAHRDTGRFPVA